MAPKDQRKNPLMHLVAGGVAGVVESSCCHPLDTIKTRMQLRTKGGSTKGPLRTASNIVSKEGFFALYKGLSAVMMGIAPKMAVRFTSFETYKEWLGASPAGNKGVYGVHRGLRWRLLMLVRDGYYYVEPQTDARALVHSYTPVYLPVVALSVPVASGMPAPRFPWARL